MNVNLPFWKGKNVSVYACTAYPFSFTVYHFRPYRPSIFMQDYIAKNYTFSHLTVDDQYFDKACLRDSTFHRQNHEKRHWISIKFAKKRYTKSWNLSIKRESIASNRTSKLEFTPVKKRLFFINHYMVLLSFNYWVNSVRADFWDRK